MSDESETRPITLDTIEKHLKKIEKDAIEAAFLHPMVLAITIILSGIAAAWSNTSGPALIVFGLLYLGYVLFQYWRKHRS
jgi:hypothetical protein